MSWHRRALEALLGRGRLRLQVDFGCSPDSARFLLSLELLLLACRPRYCSAYCNKSLS